MIDETANWICNTKQSTELV